MLLERGGRISRRERQGARAVIEGGMDCCNSMVVDVKRKSNVESKCRTESRACTSLAEVGAEEGQFGTTVVAR